MTGRVLRDDAARAAVATDFSRTLFVEAAAGTGKTGSLVRRVLRMVAAGHAGMSNVAAITFTEAAAAELRERLRRGLEEVVTLGEEPAAGRCRDAIRELDDAAVCTLHSFARRILTDAPLEAGLPPTFEVLDDSAAAADFSDAWQAFVDTLLDDEAIEDVWLRGLAVDLRLPRLRELALELHANWDRLVDVQVERCELPAVAAGPVVAAIRKACAWAGGCTDDGDALLAHLREAEAFADRLERTDDELAVLATLADAPKLDRRNVGRAGNWPDGAKDEVVAALVTAQSLVDDTVRGTRAAVLAVLLEQLVAFVLDFADRRRRAGRLEFHDLLVLARDLLRDRPDVRAALASRYRILHLDEFQDTDPLQIEIAALLAHDGEDAVGAWHDAAVGAGRLVVVGDPKQSIYRFRRADIALYHRVQDWFGAGLEQLTTNFRSEPSILAWVNHVFARLMGDGEHGVQPAYVPMDPGCDPADGAPRVRRVGAAWPGESSLVDIRTTEAGEIARLARLARGTWQVRDGDRQRAARFSDMAILVPTRRTLPHLEAALREEGVPFRIEARSLIFATQEVRDVVAVLQAIDDPGDVVALLAALRSPAFGCSDVELLEFRRAGGAWSCLEPPPPDLDPSHPVVQALDALQELHHAARWTTVSELVDRVVAQRRFLEAAFAHPRPRDRWRRLHFLADSARAFTDAGGASLREFVEWVTRQGDDNVSVNETVVPEPDDDAVRILTIHGSKGLEFPVVFVTGLSVARQPRSGAVLFDDEGRLEVRAGAHAPGWHTAGYEARSQVEQAAQRAEDVRLLYVATTRARDHLVVSLHHKAGVDCQAADLAEACADADGLWIDADPTAEDHATVDDVEGAPVAVDGDDGDRAAWIRAREERVAALARAPVMAATALASTDGDAASHGTDGDGDGSEPWRRGRAGTAVGRAVHAVLQSIDVGTGDGLDEMAAAQADAEGIPDRVDDVRRLARTAIESASVREAVASGRLWREVYVAAPLDGVLVEGYVDLLFEAADGLVVVDYKTDRTAPETSDEAFARYRLQGAAYAAALEATLGRPVARCVFVFVGSGHAVERVVDDVPAAVAEVRALVAAHHRPAFAR